MRIEDHQECGDNPEHGLGSEPCPLCRILISVAIAILIAFIIV